MNTTDKSILLTALGIGGVAIAAILGLQIYKAIENKQYRQQKLDNQESPVPIDFQKPTKLPITGKYGYGVDIKHLPAKIDMKFDATCFSNADIRITIENDKISGHQYDGGRWIVMGLENLQPGAIEEGNRLHVAYDRGSVVICNLSVEGSPQLFSQGPVVCKSSKMVGPLHWLVLNGGIWVSGNP